MLRIPIALFTIAIFTSPGLQAQSLRWVQAKPTTSPQARSDAAMVYDAERKQVVLFGGYHNGKFLGDTWIWNGKDWSRKNPRVSPAARNGHSMAYDAAKKQVVLWGGDARGSLTDTWTWDGSNWTQQKPTRSPVARLGQAMVYDADRRQVVLFGGYATTRYLNDTWTWDGSNWTQQKPKVSPTPRRSHAMAYDAAHKLVVLYGGTRGGPGYPSNTWTWDGKNWTMTKTVAVPPVLPGHSIAYDIKRKKVVLFGKYSGSTILAMTWFWDGKQWSEQKPLSSPSPRLGMAMAYDAARGETVLFGGFARGYQADTWTWNIHPYASIVAYGIPCGTFPGVHLRPAAKSLPIVGGKLTFEIRGLPTASGPGLLSLGFSRAAFGTIRLPLDLTSIGMKGCHLYNSMELQFLFTIPKTSASSFALPIPYHRSLAGKQAFAQAFGVDRSATQLGLVASNGLALTFGYR